MNADKSNKPEAGKDANQGRRLSKREAAKAAGYWGRLELAVHHLQQRLRKADKKNKTAAKKDAAQGQLSSKKEAAKLGRHWKRLDLTVHHFQEYFPLDIHPLLVSVANFYAKYGVLLSWQEARDESSIVPHLARVKERTDKGLPIKDNP